ncbi:copper chaperone CopZ [Diaminobutyricimonas aerilata]|uniref:Copper chaperone CopZ n=1 Tax=Diaminobutyricimonas aerilata TaxID=1162967 RepID=A0A2M9CMB1_9MICO|nr:heavy metal-associated domain-containing protein [Diaminobutyricimonas aerilata]PJJ73041.1 copper chaperone CopZ [Diaminobutyricimonas aerilata]
MTTTADYLVEGMTCGHCVMSVTEELTALEGVQHVEVDLRPGAASTVTVSSDAPIDPDAVRAAVGEAGYSLSDPRP